MSESAIDFWFDLASPYSALAALRIADVTRDMHGHLRVHLRSRKETLAVSETYNHLFRQM